MPEEVFKCGCGGSIYQTYFGTWKCEKCGWVCDEYALDITEIEDDDIGPV